MARWTVTLKPMGAAQVGDKTEQITVAAPDRDAAAIQARQTASFKGFGGYGICKIEEQK